MCDGISADVGGCDRLQPSFSATSCEEMAEEFGAQLDIRVRAVIDGPETLDGVAQGARMSRAMSLTVSRANQYLRETGLIGICRDPVAFAADAEPMFSARLREEAGNHIYDGTEVTYQVWRDELIRMLGVITLER